MITAVSAALVVTPGVAHAINDQVVSWSSSNAHGQDNVPATLSSGVTAISAGSVHALAVKNGGVVAWGANTGGQSSVPAAATSGVTAVAAGVQHSLALKNGGVLAWGTGMATAVPAAATSGVIGIAAGFDMSTALKSDGSIVAWGNAPVGLNGQTGVASISGNAFDVLLLRADRTIKNYSITSAGPVAPTPDTSTLLITQVAAGVSVHMALTTSGHAFAWNLGGGTYSLPSAMTSNVKAVSASWSYLLTLGYDGAVRVLRLVDGGLETTPADLTNGVDKAVLSIDSSDRWVVAIK
ncbi:hypothetical protein ACOBQX_02805 [Actinokineospora sp. G85]|uniref:hypothetical protein n=1 Tax=Actinokineospora sp. G85 TaxID=3406626 RepID=UPI003C7942CE